MFRKLLAATLCACLLFAGAVNLEGLSARADEGDIFERMENLLREKSAEADVSMAEVNGGETEETSVEEATRAYQAMQDEMFDLPEPAQDDQVYASASGVDYSIWGTSVKITLPSGSYKYSSSSTMVIYYCPTISKAIGFGRSSYVSLSTWKTVLTDDGYTTGYETINGISTVYGLKYESSSYYVEYYYNYGGYSYCVMMVQASYSEAEYFISNVMSTLRSGSTATATPKPTATPTPKPTPEPTENPWMVLPESLKRIEDEAFKGSSVVAVQLPDGCESIGAQAFANCKNLEEIYIPASVKSIADDAFEGCGEVSFSVEEMDTYAVEYADQHGIEWAMG